jgi:hypothetical protein
MGYGRAWFGLSWYGLSNYHRSTSVQVTATVAELRTLPLIAKGMVAQAQTCPLPVLVRVSVGKTHSISATGLIIGRKSRAIDAKGMVAAKKSASIGAGAWVSSAGQHVIQTGGRVAASNRMSVAVTGRVTGVSTWEISAFGYVSSEKLHTCTAGGRIADARAALIYAFGKVASPRSAGIAARGQVCGRANLSIPTRGAVSRPETRSIAVRSCIGEPHLYSISCAGHVSAPGHYDILAGGLVALGGNRAGVNVRGAVTRPQHKSIVVGGLVIASPYYSLNSWNLTGQMLEGLKASGPEPKFEKISFRGRLDSRLVDQGYGPMEYTFDVHFSKIDDAFEYVRQMQDSSGDGRFYPGDSAYFHKVRAVATERVRRRGRYMFVIKTKVYLEKPYLYSDQCSEWSLDQVSLPRTSGNFINRGHIDMPLELVRIVGRYNTTYVKGLKLSIMDGVTEVACVPLSDRLLSDEVLELDEDGVLTCTYSDDYSSCTRFTRDAVSSNAYCSAGKVTIGNNGYVVYEFRGVWPLMQNMILTAVLNVLGGSPAVEVSTDGGATYTQVISGSQILSGVKATYYLTDTTGYRNVLVRFRCGSSDSLEIDEVEFKGVRRISTSQIPKIAAGSTRQIRITDDPASGHLVDIYARFREARLPV